MSTPLNLLVTYVGRLAAEVGNWRRCSRDSLLRRDDVRQRAERHEQRWSRDQGLPVPRLRQGVLASALPLQTPPLRMWQRAAVLLPPLSPSNQTQTCLTEAYSVPACLSQCDVETVSEVRKYWTSSYSCFCIMSWINKSKMKMVINVLFEPCSTLSSSAKQYSAVSLNQLDYFDHFWTPAINVYRHWTDPSCSPWTPWKFLLCTKI